MCFEANQLSGDVIVPGARRPAIVRPTAAVNDQHRLSGPNNNVGSFVMFSDSLFYISQIITKQYIPLSLLITIEKNTLNNKVIN